MLSSLSSQQQLFSQSSSPCSAQRKRYNSCHCVCAGEIHAEKYVCPKVTKSAENYVFHASEGMPWVWQTTRVHIGWLRPHCVNVPAKLSGRCCPAAVGHTLTPSSPQASPKVMAAPVSDTSPESPCEKSYVRRTSSTRANSRVVSQTIASLAAPGDVSVGNFSSVLPALPSVLHRETPSFLHPLAAVHALVQVPW